MTNPYPFTDILKTIELIRESFDGAAEVYTQGSCVRFALILSHIYPGGRILYDYSHAIFEYDGKHYDINGFAAKSQHHVPLKEIGEVEIFTAMGLKYRKHD